MPLTALSQIINLPEKCSLSEIQGTMVEVYEMGKHNDKNKQNFTMKDSSGVLVRGTAWGHDDISYYKGKEVIIKAGPKGGLAVNNYQGKAGVSVSATCSFQTVAGGAAPQAAIPANPSHSVASANTNTAPHVRPAIQGQTIGMCFKLAGDYIISNKSIHGSLTPQEFADAVRETAQKLIISVTSLE